MRPFCLACTALLLSCWLLAGPAAAFDLYQALALPSLPPPLAEPGFLPKDRTLTISSTWEEMYRKWQDGSELARFVGNRQDARLTWRVTDRFGLAGSWRLAGTQDWMNRETGKIDQFSLDNSEDACSLALRWWGNDHAVEYRTIQSSDRFSGRYSLHEDLVKALGSQPDLDFETLTGGTALRIAGHWNDLVYEGETARTRIDHSIRTLRTRLALLVPQHRTVKEIGGTVTMASRDLVQPFFRWFRRTEEGLGVSVKDGRFVFGHSGLDLALNGHALGLAVKRRRRPWFVEFTRHSLSGTARFAFNLITLDPLFLFATNEVDTTVTVPQEHPWTARLGGSFRLPRGITGSGQYGLTRLDFQTVQAQEKVLFFRSKTEPGSAIRSFRYWFHRAELSFSRKDSSGAWSTRLRLMAPQEIKKPSKKEPVPPGPPGPPAPSAQKPKETIRGGWQFTIERSYSFR